MVPKLNPQPPCPDCFPAIPTPPTSNYLDQVSLVNQKLKDRADPDNQQWVWAEIGEKQAGQAGLGTKFWTPLG